MENQFGSGGNSEMADEKTKAPQGHTHAKDVEEQSQKSTDPGRTPGKAEGPNQPSEADKNSNDPGRTPGKAEG
jgi:hypothetical protein